MVTAGHRTWRRAAVAGHPSGADKESERRTSEPTASVAMAKRPLFHNQGAPHDVAFPIDPTENGG